MNQIMDDEDVNEQWFTIFQWRIDRPEPTCQILSRKGPIEKIEKLAAKHEGTHLLFGIQHEEEEECKGLAHLLRRLLKGHKGDGPYFLGNEACFDDLVDIFACLSTGQWGERKWERLEDHASMDELEVLYHPKDFLISYASIPRPPSVGDEPPGVLQMLEALDRHVDAPSSD